MGRAAVLARPVAIFAASRAVVLVAMWLATRLQPELTMSDALSSWDGAWYLLAAEEGYPSTVPDGASTLAFFPMYPLLVQGVAALTGMSVLGAALIVGAVGGFAAATLIWVLGRHLLGTDVADRTVALFAFFPGSFVLSMVYSEGIMLALAAACLWALVARRWLLAGVLGALTTASRPNAVAIVGSCAWASAVAVWSHGTWRSLVAPVLAPAGILAFFAALWVRTGEATAWFQAQRAGWGERVAPLALLADVRQLARDPFLDMNNTVVVAGAVVAAVGLVLILRSGLPGEVVAFALIVLALAFVSETLGPRPRFILTAFPVFFGLARHLRGMAFASVLAMSACTLGAFTVLSVTSLLATP